MGKKYKSGALKCKEHEQRRSLVASCVPLTNFFVPARSQPSTSSSKCPTASPRLAKKKRHAASSVHKAEVNMQESDDDDDDAEDSDDDEDNNDDGGEGEINEDPAVVSDGGGSDDVDDNNDDGPIETAAAELRAQASPLSSDSSPESDQCASGSGSTTGGPPNLRFFHTKYGRAIPNRSLLL